MSTQVAPFSIYIDLEEGRTADLETIARSSLELIAAVKEFAYFVDPRATVEIKISSGEEGSLWLKNLVKLVFDIDVDHEGKPVEIKVNTMQAILIGIGIYLGGSIASHYTEMGLQTFDREVLGLQPDGQPVKEPDKAAIVPLHEHVNVKTKETVLGAIHNGMGDTHIRRFYAEIKNDTAIKAVGLSYSHEDKPLKLIPRSKFDALSRSPQTANRDGEKRKRVDQNVEVLLTQPRLTADKRAWRFQVGGVEFSARVTDEKFVTDLLSGKTKVPMVEGLYLLVDLAYEEQMKDGVWNILSRTITRVYNVRGVPQQTSLFPSLDQQ